MRTYTAAGMVGALGVVWLTAGCNLDIFGNTAEETADVEVVLGNSSQDGQPIHILKPGEGFAPSNRIDPGSIRTVIIPVGKNGVEFRAGRNGEVLTDVTCVSQNPQRLSLSGFRAFVSWDGARLNCMDWDQ